MTLIQNPFSRYEPFTVGFDRALRRLDSLAEVKAPSYPPYNIVQVDDDNYVVELAVAGFTEQDLSIELKEQVLTVTASVEKNDESKYVHRGIAKRNFTRSFTLADTIEVVNANLTDGMLRIELRNLIPEHKKARQIAISGSKQFLTE
jgi:molecular chaperone IbpA